MEPLISKAAVGRLNNHALRSVLNVLLTIEANRAGVPLTDLDLTCRDNDKDAGVDGRLIWPKGANHDVLRSGPVVLQYKSGKLKKGEIRKEFVKKGVQNVLKKPSGQYILFVSHDYVRQSRDRHLKSLAALCKRRRIAPRRCHIVYGDQIARWISRFPSVVILPELGSGYPAFVTVNQWQQSRNLKNPFKLNTEREEVIKQLRSFAISTVDDNIFRVEGLAGVGKTRLVLEALRVSGIAESTMYCFDADSPNALQLLAELQAHVDASAVIVLDECDRERQETLRPYVENAGGRLRLVCVGPAEKLLPTQIASGALYQVKPLPEEEMRSVIGDFHANAPREIVDTAVRLAGGMPKLAVFIADTLIKKQGLRLNELVEVDTVQSFLKRFVDKDTFDTLKGLSLLAKVGWDGELEVEAKAIAEKGLLLPFHQMQRSVKRLKDQGVVLSRGKYLYVSPDLLAISAAAELWDERGAKLIGIISDLPGPGPRRQFLRRLATMTDFPTVRQATERLLGTQGLYSTIEELDHEFSSEVFRYLAAALPEMAQEALDRVFEGASDERLQGFKRGRREVMWALESLLRWPETSLAAARIVIRLALNENETVANNATGVLQQYFFAFLSGSPVPLGERLQLVRELLEGSEPRRRILAVKAASASLSFYEVRMGGDVDELSRRSYPADWKPKTWGELWDARRVAIEQLTFISNGTDEASALAREALFQSVFALLRHGQAKDAITILRNNPPRNDKERLEVIDSANRLLKEASATLDNDERQTLVRIAGEAFGPDYFDRLRRWVGRRTHSDYDLEGGTGFNNADRKVVELAEEGFTQGIPDKALAWLTLPEAENVWVFGRRLGELDTDRLFLEPIISKTPADLNCMLLSSYLVGLAGNIGRAASEQILNELENRNPTLAFGASWRVGPSEEGGRRVIRLMESGRLEPSTYRAFRYGSWVESLPTEITVAIIKLLIREDPLITNEPAVAILDHMIAAHPAIITDVENLVWEALERAPLVRTTDGDWQWGQLASRVASHAPAKVAKLVLDRLDRDPNPHIGGDPLIEILSQVTKESAGEVWQLVGSALLRTDGFDFRLRLMLKKWYGDLIPTPVLIAWAKDNQPRGPVIVADLVGIGAPLPERARQLVATFPNNDKIFSVFAGNLQTGTFVGPISGHLEGVLGTVRQWEKDQDPHIRDWARRLASRIAKEVAEQKLIEEGEDI
jgi:hypothetical protein